MHFYLAHATFTLRKRYPVSKFACISNRFQVDDSLDDDGSQSLPENDNDTTKSIKPETCQRNRHPTADPSYNNTMMANKTLSSMLLLVLVATVLSSLNVSCSAYSTPFFQTVRSSMTMKRGRGSFQKESGMGVSPSSGGGGNINWCTMPAGNRLPKEEGIVTLMDTQLPTMKKGATNPTGAVAVVKYNDQTYCFGSSCPSCKIPLVKAKVYPPAADDDKAPRLTCDFCKSTYSLSTGGKVEEAESAGFFGGIVKSVMSAQASGSLPIYKLGEKNGKLLIAVD